MRAATGISERRACELLGLSRTVLHYQPLISPATATLSARMIELAGERRRFGYRRLGILLGREGLVANHKRIYRLYRNAGLSVRRRRKRHGVALERQPLQLPAAPNQVWSMDFVMDQLATGRRIKCLTIVDDFTKESLEIRAEFGISGEYVTRILDEVATFRGYPAAVRTDQGPEFTGKALDQWAHQHRVALKLIQPGKPIQNAFIESFNGRFRDECLNDHWFNTLAQAQDLITAWRNDYNQARPHSALRYLTPAEFAAGWRSLSPPRAVEK